MKEQNGRGFLSGMLLGVVLSLLTSLIGVYLLIVLDVVSVSLVDTPGFQAVSEWTRRNLGLSVLPLPMPWLDKVKAIPICWPCSLRTWQ